MLFVVLNANAEGFHETTPFRVGLEFETPRLQFLEVPDDHMPAHHGLAMHRPGLACQRAAAHDAVVKIPAAFCDEFVLSQVIEDFPLKSQGDTWFQDIHRRRITLMRVDAGVGYGQWNATKDGEQELHTTG